MKVCSRCGDSGVKFPKMGTKCQRCLNKMGYAQKQIKFANIRAHIETVKAVPCMDCNIQYPPYCMDFDHRPGEEKSFNISTYMRANKSLEQVIQEIAKCDLVCANCHRIRTFSRLGKSSVV